MRKLSRRATRDGGNATLEFAMFAVLGVSLLMVGTDLVSYLRSKLRLDQVSGGLANMVTEYQQLYAGDFPVLFQAGQLMAGAIDVSGGNGATVITGIVNLTGSPVIVWRQQNGSAGFSSSFGAVGGTPANLPDSYALPAGSSLVAVEVFSAVHPWVLSQTLMGTAGSPTVRSAAFYQPRASLLSQITAGNRP